MQTVGLVVAFLGVGCACFAFGAFCELRYSFSRERWRRELAGRGFGVDIDKLD